MPTPNYIIMRQRLEITVADKDCAQQVKDQMIQQIQQQLNELLDKFFSTHVPDDVIINIEELVIDSGLFDIATIDQEDFAKKLGKKIVPELKKKVVELINNPTQKDITPLYEAKMKALQHYLTKGSFPWWMPINNHQDIEETYLNLIQENPKRLKKFWFSSQKNPKAIKRFTTHFSKDTIQKTFALLVNNISPQNSFLLGEEIIALQQENGLPLLRKSTIEQTVWEVILTQIVKRQGASLSRPHLTKTIAHKIAHASQQSYETVLQKIGGYYSKNRANKEMPYGTLEGVITQSDEVPPVQKNNEEPIVSTTTLVQQLNNALIKQSSQEVYKPILNQLLQRANEPGVLQLLKGWLKVPSNLAQLSQSLPKENLIYLIEKVAPTIAPICKLLGTLWTSSTANLAISMLPKRFSIEQLTLHYVGKYSTSSNFNSYLKCITHQLQLDKQSGPLLNQLLTMLQRNKETFIKNYTKNTVNKVVSLLSTVAITGKSIDNRIERVDKVKIERKEIREEYIQQIIKKTKGFGDLSGAIQEEIGVKIEELIIIMQQKEHKDNKGINTILNKNQLQEKIITNVNAIIAKQANKKERKAPVDPKVLQAAITDIVQSIGSLPPVKKRKNLLPLHHHPFSIKALHAFLLKNTLPKGYGDVSSFIQKTIELSTPVTLRKYITPLFHKKEVTEKLIQYIPPTGNTYPLLFKKLIPFDTTLVTELENLVLTATIIKADTLSAKKERIATTLLEATIPPSPTSPGQFIQQFLLQIANNNHFNLASMFKKLKTTIEGRQFLPIITSTITTVTASLKRAPSTICSELDTNLFATHESIAAQININVVPPYYQVLLPFMKEAIEQGIPPSNYKSRLTKLINNHFITSSPVEKQTISDLVTQKLLTAAQKHNRSVKKTWHHFLHTGTLAKYKKIGKLLDAFLQNKPQKINYLHNLLQQAHIRKRLIACLNQQQLTKLIMSYYPHSGTTIIKHIDRIPTLWHTTNKDIKNNKITKEIWWDTVLENLTPDTTIFNTNNWLSKSLLTFAIQIKVPPVTLLDKLKLATNDLLDIEESTAITETLTTIQEQWKNKNETKSVVDWPQNVVLQQLHQLLTTGTTPFNHEEKVVIPDLEEAIQPLLQTSTATIKKALRSYTNSTLIATRITHYFSQNTINHFIQVLAAENYSFISAYIALSNHHALVAIDSTMWTNNNMVAILDYLLQPVLFHKETFIQHCLKHLAGNSHEVLQLIQKIIQEETTMTNNKVAQYITQLKYRSIIAVSESAPNSAEQEGEAISSKPIYTKGEEMDSEDSMAQEVAPVRVYIENGGIIFLWPFIEQLFATQGLTKDGTFINEVAQHNGVHTLQYMVTDNLQNPEWQLIFPKLLAGLPYNHVVTKNYQFSQSTSDNKQQEEATKVVVAKELLALQDNITTTIMDAIKSWKNLENFKKIGGYQGGITKEQFRDYFLAREGVLEYIATNGQEEPYWHLTLTMKPYDDSLQIIPPWATEEFKLPWMPHKVVIFLIPS